MFDGQCTHFDPFWAFRSAQQICKQQLQKPLLTTHLITHHNHASQPASNNSHRNNQHRLHFLYHPRRWTLLTFKMCLPSPRIFDTCLRYKVLSSLDMCASYRQLSSDSQTSLSSKEYSRTHRVERVIERGARGYAFDLVKTVEPMLVVILTLPNMIAYTVLHFFKDGDQCFCLHYAIHWHTVFISTYVLTCWHVHQLHHGDWGVTQLIKHIKRLSIANQRIHETNWQSMIALLCCINSFTEFLSTSSTKLFTPRFGFHDWGWCHFEFRQPGVPEMLDMLSPGTPKAPLLSLEVEKPSLEVKEVLPLLQHDSFFFQDSSLGNCFVYIVPRPLSGLAVMAGMVVLSRVLHETWLLK